jgi:MoxR-like ATPase
VCRADPFFQDTRRNLLRNFLRLYRDYPKPLEAEGFLRVP